MKIRFFLVWKKKFNQTRMVIAPELYSAVNRRSISKVLCCHCNIIPISKCNRINLSNYRNNKIQLSFIKILYLRFIFNIITDLKIISFNFATVYSSIIFGRRCRWFSSSVRPVYLASSSSLLVFMSSVSLSGSVPLSSLSSLSLLLKISLTFDLDPTT